MFIATSWETANDRMVIERIFSVDSRIKLWKITEFCSFQTSRVKRFKKLLKEFNRFSRSIIKYKLCYYFVFSYLLQLKGAQWSSNNAFIYWNRKLCLKLQKTIIFINKEPSKICKNQDCYSQRPFLPIYSLFIQVQYWIHANRSWWSVGFFQIEIIFMFFPHSSWIRRQSRL